MLPRNVLAALIASGLLAVVSAFGEPLAVVPCGDLPAGVLALVPAAELEAFGVAAGADVSVATSPSPRDPGRSVLRFARGGGAFRAIPLQGRVTGLAVAGDGSRAFAVVRLIDRKGSVRDVELVGVDLQTARVTVGPSLPATSVGLALSASGTSLLVACKDEIRTFQLPRFSSGPLYRVLGPNLGVAPIGDTSRVLLAQTNRLVLVDLSRPQGRDGLALSHETVVTTPLRALMASVGERSPIALSAGGDALCPRLEAFEAEIAVERGGGEPTPSAAPPEQPAPEPSPTPAPTPAPVEPGTVFGQVEGPARRDVGAILLLGPDNVLREAARSIPDGDGRFVAAGLRSGSYRIVATGVRGRVLICDPPFVTVRVKSNGSVESPVLKVLRTQ